VTRVNRRCLSAPFHAVIHALVVLAFGVVLCAAAGSSFAVDLAGAVTCPQNAVTCPQNASFVASTSMGALAPNIFYYRVIDMHSLARGLNLLCILGLRLAVGINSSFLAQLGCRAVRCIAAGLGAAAQLPGGHFRLWNK
jgi:hypothetical protein